eukprot:Rhum_TRINITY_DN13757_c3_g1::Rhum_TRINITY_DN13757_c3_g1_i4::g.63115::m.63115
MRFVIRALCGEGGGGRSAGAARRFTVCFERPRKRGGRPVELGVWPTLRQNQRCLLQLECSALNLLKQQREIGFPRSSCCCCIGGGGSGSCCCSSGVWLLVQRLLLRRQRRRPRRLLLPRRREAPRRRDGSAAPVRREHVVRCRGVGGGGRRRRRGRSRRGVASRRRRRAADGAVPRAQHRVRRRHAVQLRLQYLLRRSRGRGGLAGHRRGRSSGRRHRRALALGRHAAVLRVGCGHRRGGAHEGRQGRERGGRQRRQTRRGRGGDDDGHLDHDGAVHAVRHDALRRRRDGGLCGRRGCCRALASQLGAQAVALEPRETELFAEGIVCCTGLAAALLVFVLKPTAATPVGRHRHRARLRIGGRRRRFGLRLRRLCRRRRRNAGRSLRHCTTARDAAHRHFRRRRIDGAAGQRRGGGRRRGAAEAAARRCADVGCRRLLRAAPQLLDGGGVVAH